MSVPRRHSPEVEPAAAPKPPVPLRLVLDLPCQTSADKVVLLTMAEKCHWASRRFAKPLDELAALSGLSRRTVQASVLRLRASGRIRAEKRRKNGVWVYEVVIPEAAKACPLKAPPLAVSGRDAWRVQEILAWARELGLRPASSDVATAREWAELGISRLVLLGTLRLGVLRKRQQRSDAPPIGSLRYFEKILPEVDNGEPDSPARESYVAMLGRKAQHEPLLPLPPEQARRAFEAASLGGPGVVPPSTGNGRAVRLDEHDEHPRSVSQANDEGDQGGG